MSSLLLPAPAPLTPFPHCIPLQECHVLEYTRFLPTHSLFSEMISELRSSSFQSALALDRAPSLAAHAYLFVQSLAQTQDPVPVDPDFITVLIPLLIGRPLTLLRANAVLSFCLSFALEVLPDSLTSSPPTSPLSVKNISSRKMIDRINWSSMKCPVAMPSLARNCQLLPENCSVSEESDIVLYLNLVSKNIYQLFGCAPSSFFSSIKS